MITILRNLYFLFERYNRPIKYIHVYIYVCIERCPIRKKENWKRTTK